jgi:hypothetical protein
LASPLVLVTVQVDDAVEHVVIGCAQRFGVR